MLNKIMLALSLIDKRSRKLVQILAIFRILISALDIAGIILIGLLLAKSAEELTGDKSATPFSGLIDIPKEISLLTLAIISLVTFLSKSALALFFMKLMANTLAEAESQLAKKTFEKFFLLNRDNLSKFSKPEVSFALTYSASFAVTNLLTMFIIVISETALLIAVVTLFAFVNLKISFGIAIYFALVGIIIHKVLGNRMQSAGKMYADSATDSNEIAEDSIEAIREILTLRKENEFTEKFGKQRFGLAKASANITFYGGFPRYIVESALMVGTIALAGYVFGFANTPTAAGLLGIFLTGGLRITASIIPLQSALAAIKQFGAQAEPFFKLAQKTRLIGEFPDSSFRKNENRKNPIEVELNNVSYTYSGSDIEVLKNISLKIHSGEYVAIIGPSGSGKSTLADLISGLTIPTKGELKYLNVPQESAHLGYVPQSPGIIHGSILDNVTLNVNSAEYDPEKLYDSILSAHLSELISSLKNGIYTNLGEQADSLSGGQIQRIGLARALYAQPRLLILDEATSSLDPETESAFAETLNKLKGKCSIVVIAHRLSTVKNADRVYVVDKGQIVASGKFDELARTNGLVARYVELSHLHIQ